MHLFETFSIKRYHREKIEAFGIQSHRSVGWLSEAAQMARFDAQLKLGNMNGHSVLDIGCGKGDFRKSLQAAYPDARYFGVDINEELLDEGVRVYGHLPETVFLKGDFSVADLPATDFIVASGALSYYSEDEQYLFNTIGKLYATCGMAFGFNLLSKLDEPHHLLRAYDKEHIYTFCRSLSAKTMLLDQYREHDFTIFLYK